MTVRIYKVAPTKASAIRQVLSADHFARNGYLFQMAKSLGFDIDDYYFLYIKADDSFFAAHAKELVIPDVVEVKGNEFDNVKRAFESAEDDVASGIALFG